MLRYLLLALLYGVVRAGYPDGSSGNSIGDSYGYGYSGGFSGTEVPQGFPVPQFNFPAFLGNYLENINRYHQEFIKKGGGAFSYSHASSTPNGKAEASSSIKFNKINRRKIGIPKAKFRFVIPSLQAQAAQAGQGGYAQPGGYGTSFGGSYGGPGGGGFAFSGPPGGGAASATGSVGPGGVHQTASVYPENPNSPNINTRFAASDTPSGFRSVFTSSSSQTTNVNGVPHTVQQASTTVNDNGKVTTYTAKNP